MKYKKNFTDVFPAIFSEVNGSELMVYLYICHHFCLTDQPSIKITYDEMCKGTLIDRGTTLSKDTIRRSVQSLKELKLLKIRKQTFRATDGSKMTPHFYKPMVPVQFKPGSESGPSRTDFQIVDDLSTEENRYDFASESRTDFNAHISLKEIKENLSLEKEEDLRQFEKSDLPLLNNSKEPKAPPSKHEQAAIIMWNTLSRLGRKEPNSKKHNWIRDFKDFTSKDTAFDIDRVLVVLKWWCRELPLNLRDIYFPKPKCPKSFCERLISIEDRMNALPLKQPKPDFHSTENLPPPEDDTPPLDDQLRRDAMSHLL